VCMTILSYCCKPTAMLNHFGRVVRPDILDSCAAAADSHIASALTIAARLPDGTIAPNQPDRTLEQLQLPAGDCGGGAFVSLQRILPGAYLGGLADTLTTICAYDHAAQDLFNDTSAWAHSASTSLGSAVTAFDDVTSAMCFHDPRKIDKTAYNTVAPVVVAPDGSEARSPVLANLSQLSGKHPQRLFCSALTRTDFHTIVNDNSVDEDARSRIRQCSQQGALRFQFAIPSTKARTLGDREYLANFRHCYGLDQPDLRPGSRCTERCHTHGPSAAIDEVIWKKGAHLLSCGCSPWRLKRHNALGDDVLKLLFKELGYTWDPKDVHVHLDNGKRLDARCSNTAEDPVDAGIDITVGCPACETHVCAAACRSASYTTDKLARAKIAKHGAATAVAGLKLLPAAFTTYGGWGDEILKYLEKAYQARLKQEKEEGGLGWKAHQWKVDMLEKMSIRIARSNYQLLSAFTPPRDA
jgi:hypothetical protein